MIISRVWAMPNKRTFQIKPIKELIKDEVGAEKWLDLFPYPFKEDALKVLFTIEDGSLDGVLFDPPYSPRQLKECYDSLGQSLTSLDTSNHTWRQWKDEAARVIKPGGRIICFGWNSNGLGINRGFTLEKILLVAHGGNHNDTIVTVERKANNRLEG